jgi:hypothetical protein
VSGRGIGALLLLALATVAPRADNPPRAEFEARFARNWGARIESALAAVGSVPVPAHPDLPADVRDGVLGYLITLLDGGAFGTTSGADLTRVLQASGRRSRIPVEKVVELRRAPTGIEGEAWLRASFVAPLRVPVPYSILGYHPGSLGSTQQVTAREWHSARSLINDPAGEVTAALELEDLTLWGFVEGRVLIDIDAVIDKLMGSSLDDTIVIGLAFFRFRGEPYAMAIGYNRQGEPRSGALSLIDDEIRFPTPPELKAVARDLRGRLVRHLTQMGLPAWMPE